MLFKDKKNREVWLMQLEFPMSYQDIVCHDTLIAKSHHFDYEYVAFRINDIVRINEQMVELMLTCKDHWANGFTRLRVVDDEQYTMTLDLLNGRVIGPSDNWSHIEEAFKWTQNQYSWHKYLFLSDEEGMLAL